MRNITTDRLLIRLAKPEDVASIYSYHSDFIENKYQGWHPGSVEGFRKEVYFRESYYLRGEWVNDIIYAMLRKEWADKTTYN